MLYRENQSGIYVTLIINTSSRAEKSGNDQHRSEKQCRPGAIFKINYTGTYKKASQAPPQ